MPSTNHAFNAIDGENPSEGAAEHAEDKSAESAYHSGKKHFNEPLHVSTEAAALHYKAGRANPM